MLKQLRRRSWARLGLSNRGVCFRSVSKGSNLLERFVITVLREIQNMHLKASECWSKRVEREKGVNIPETRKTCLNFVDHEILVLGLHVQQRLPNE